MKHVDTDRLAKKALRDALMSTGLSQGFASQLVSGRMKPSEATAEMIERELGIPAAIWATRPPLKEMWAIARLAE